MTPQPYQDTRTTAQTRADRTRQARIDTRLQYHLEPRVSPTVSTERLHGMGPQTSDTRASLETVGFGLHMGAVKGKHGPTIQGPCSLLGSQDSPRQKASSPPCLESRDQTNQMWPRDSGEAKSKAIRRNPGTGASLIWDETNSISKHQRVSYSRRGNWPR